jgi:hypothetical protein
MLLVAAVPGDMSQLVKLALSVPELQQLLQMAACNPGDDHESADNIRYSTSRFSDGLAVHTTVITDSSTDMLAAYICSSPTLIISTVGTEENTILGR